MYTEEEVLLILDKTLAEHSDKVLADIPEWFNQFRKTGSKFPNGITSWIETHHEVVAEITGIALTDASEGEVFTTRESYGTGGLYELAESLTDEFETLNAGREWDGEFFDEIDSFLNSKNL